MPAKEAWEDFFKPAEVLKIMGVDHNVLDVAEFGCGYGTFTIPAAKVANGTVYAMDIEAEMIAITEEASQRHGLRNVKTVLRDFVADGTGLRSAIIDYVMLFNILHVEQPETLLQEAHRILRPKGRLGIIHWNYDPTTPRGPSMSIRPKPEQCVAWAKQAGFVAPVRHDLKPYHYGIVMKKGAEQ
jgi:ubiquinone/menaquinone biosynthesis C-methylase UbiE